VPRQLQINKGFKFGEAQQRREEMILMRKVQKEASANYPTWMQAGVTFHLDNVNISVHPK
jgi:hypothetical protein